MSREARATPAAEPAPLRITQVMLSKGFGGGERYFVDLVHALAESGHAVQALCHRRYVEVDGLRRPGVRVDAVESRGMWDWWSVREMRRRVADFGPHLLHSHMARGAWAASKIAARLGAPLVATTHNYVNLKYYPQVHTFIPTTADQERYLADSGVPAPRLARIPNFSALPPAAEAAPGWEGAPRFVSVGRFVEKKGFHVLLDALARVRADGVGDATLLLGGDGPWRERLAAQARALGIEAAVDFAGWVDDVGGFLRRGDVFVLPSLDEPFGIVMLEAMAAGRPIVSTLTKGPSEVLDEGTALLVPLGDADALAAAMGEAARDPAASVARAARALAVYRDHYHRDAVVPRIVSLYRDVLAAPGPPALD